MANVTEQFGLVIKGFLEEQAFRDPLFAKKLENKNKSLEECVAYILNTVKQSGKAGFTDEEIFNMAMHYYDEEDVKAGAMPNVNKIVMNAPVKLTAEEIAEAKQKALDQVIAEEKRRIREKPKKTVKKEEPKQDNNTLF